MSEVVKPNLPLTMVPSLPAASFAELQHLVEKLDGVAPGFQIDIVDGKFVPAKSWPFNQTDPVGELERINELPTSYAYELDCMIMEPELYLSSFAALPLKKVIIHAGSTDRYGKIINHARDYKYEIGIAFTNDVPLSFIRPYIEKIDFVQVMGIAKVGKQGQSFDERTLATVATLRQEYPDLFIAVDGSVNKDTIPKLLAAGVNHFAPGSAISHAPDPVKAYKQLMGLLRW